MPPNPPGMKKKKKGPAPAHQNKFAFKHNPRSKTTEKILSSPNVHVCRRCHDKIEWRKQYRKYKPRTQPGTCNECQKRNVLAAYHTICESCSRVSAKARALIAAAMEEQEEQTPAAVEGEETLSQTPIGGTSTPSKLRACAVCVKELALPDPQEDEEENDLADQLGLIRLRERRAIERKLEQEARAAKQARRLARQQQNGESNDDDQKSNGDPAASDVDSVELSDDEDEEDDPFLRAVGGADKLLTGAAYQAKLLEQMQQSEQES